MIPDFVDHLPHKIYKLNIKENPAMFGYDTSLHNQDIVSLMERFGAQADPDFNSLNPSSLTFSKLKRYYEDERRKKKQKDIENLPQIFKLTKKQPRLNMNNNNSSNGSSLFLGGKQPPIISSNIKQNPNFMIQDLQAMIKMFKNLSVVSDVTILQSCILDKISQMKTTPQQMLTLLSKLLYTPLYIRSREKYQLLEQKIFEILTKLNFEKTPPEILSNFIQSLPYPSESTLPLISYFLQFIEESEYTKTLSALFRKLLPSNPTKTQIRYFMRIADEDIINPMVNFFYKDPTIFPLACEEAVQKLRKMPKVFNKRGEAMMQFVFTIIIYGGDQHVWTEIIEWEKTASAEYKNYFRKKSEEIFTARNDEEEMDNTIKLLILSKLTNVSHDSEIAEIFFRSTLNNKDKNFINCLIVKKFLASKLAYKVTKLKTALNIEADEKPQELQDQSPVQEQNPEEAVPYLDAQPQANSSPVPKSSEDPFAQLQKTGLHIMFSQDLLYSDVLLHLFHSEKDAQVFYEFFLNFQQGILVHHYLDRLLYFKKAKFRAFFINFMTHDSGTLMFCNSNMLSEYYKRTLSFELIYSIVKELSVKPPGRLYMMFIVLWLRVLSQNKYYRHFRNNVIQQINTMLIRADLELHRDFINQFNQLLWRKELTSEEKPRVMQDVPRHRKELVLSSHHI